MDEIRSVFATRADGDHAPDLDEAQNACEKLRLNLLSNVLPSNWKPNFVSPTS